MPMRAQLTIKDGAKELELAGVTATSGFTHLNLQIALLAAHKKELHHFMVPELVHWAWRRLGRQRVVVQWRLD